MIMMISTYNKSKIIDPKYLIVIDEMIRPGSPILPLKLPSHFLEKSIIRCQYNLKFLDDTILYFESIEQ